MSLFSPLYPNKPLAFASLTLVMLVMSCTAHYPVSRVDKPAQQHQGSPARGRNLTLAICAPCHYNKAAHSMIGKEVWGMPRIAGRLHSGNLTHSATHGKLDKYGDAALIYLIRTGIARDGRFIPYMMRPNIADEDADDIVAFLRSSDTLLRARDTAAGRTRLTAAGRLGQRLLTRPQPYRTGVRRPAAQDSIALGRYLVDNIGCFHCHSKSVLSINHQRPEHSKGYLAGGTKFITDEGRIRTPNIRFDTETGIGGYTKADLRRVLQQGIGKDGHQLRAPAEVFPVTDEESDAIYAYLKSLPPVRHRVKPPAGSGKDAHHTFTR